LRRSTNPNCSWQNSNRLVTHFPRRPRLAEQVSNQNCVPPDLSDATAPEGSIRHVPCRGQRVCGHGSGIGPGKSREADPDTNAAHLQARQPPTSQGFCPSRSRPMTWCFRGLVCAAQQQASACRHREAVSVETVKKKTRQTGKLSGYLGIRKRGKARVGLCTGSPHRGSRHTTNRLQRR
jgi:hypothetical protein